MTKHGSRREGLTHVDGILLTHSHNDHIGGIDELRQLNNRMKRSISLYGNAETLAGVRDRYRYLFQAGVQVGGGLPSVELHEVTPFVPFDPAPQLNGGAGSGVAVTPVPVLHGALGILGYWFGTASRLAYITDASKLPHETTAFLGNGAHPRTLVINALRHEEHPTHLTVAQALGVVREINPGRAFFVHFSHAVSHETLLAELPENVRPAYDGLKLEIPLN
eukprot:m51a1_g13353 hypothetical protein (221) ;mRNA; f:245-907